MIFSEFSASSPVLSETGTAARIHSDTGAANRIQSNAGAPTSFLHDTAVPARILGYTGIPPGMAVPPKSKIERYILHYKKYYEGLKNKTMAEIWNYKKAFHRTYPSIWRLKIKIKV